MSSQQSQSYDRSVFGSDDCTKETGKCSCCMCSTTPLVIIPSGEPICSQYNITLRNVQEYLDGGLLKTLHEESFMIYRQVKCDGTCQIGIFAAIEVDDCAKRVVRPHEKVTCKTDITVHNKPVQLRVRRYSRIHSSRTNILLIPLLNLFYTAIVHGSSDVVISREQGYQHGCGPHCVAR